MYVIRMMEHALDQCELPCTKKADALYAPGQKAQCDDSPVRAWDQAVAFYTGSLEGDSGGGEGVLFFDLADTMCARFLTCGDRAELRFGVSYVNNVAINDFIKGQIHVLKRECGMARKKKNEIVKIMAVPLIQATLLNAYEQVNAKKSGEEEQAKAAVQGASYTATILPLVHECSPEDAQTIYENLRFGKDVNATQSLDFVKVKEALERNYKCMGISCKSVGGIWEGRDYFPLASPCQDEIDVNNSKSNIHIGLVIASAGGALIICVLLYITRQRCKKGIDREFHDLEPSSSPEDVFQQGSRATMD
jgi:hypothetical protein